MEFGLLPFAIKALITLAAFGSKYCNFAASWAWHFCSMYPHYKHLKMSFYPSTIRAKYCSGDYSSGPQLGCRVKVPVIPLYRIRGLFLHLGLPPIIKITKQGATSQKNWETINFILYNKINNCIWTLQQPNLSLALDGE